MANGSITQVIGSTFDVEFPEKSIPAIYNAVRIDTAKAGIELHLVGEVQQHLGGGKSTAAGRWRRRSAGRSTAIRPRSRN